MVTWEQNAYFAAIPSAKLVQIQNASVKRNYGRGETIWFNGLNVDFVGFIESGFVKMAKPTAIGTDVAMEIFGPGQLFGSLGALDGKGCPLSAYAVGKVQLFAIPKPLMRSIYEEVVDVRELIFRRTLTRFRHAYSFRAILLTGRADQKVAAILLELAESFGRQVGAEVCLEVPVTRQDIADMVGIAPETAIRILTRMQVSGLIRTIRRSLVLVRVQSLRSVVDGIETTVE